MSTLEIFQTLTDYNYRLYERLWESIHRLTEAQFVQEVNYSHGSLRNHLVHIAGVDGRWVRGLKGLPTARDFNPNAQNYPTRAQVQTLWDDVAQEVRAYVAGLDDASLGEIAPGMAEPVWQILTHILNHGTDHRAQMLRLLHDFGAPTFDQDLIMYLWDRGTPA